jgi:hypothetical protein
MNLSQRDKPSERFCVLSDDSIGDRVNGFHGLVIGRMRDDDGPRDPLLGEERSEITIASSFPFRRRREVVVR